MTEEDAWILGPFRELAIKESEIDSPEAKEYCQTLVNDLQDIANETENTQRRRFVIVNFDDAQHPSVKRKYGDMGRRYSGLRDIEFTITVPSESSPLITREETLHVYSKIRLSRDGFFVKEHTESDIDRVNEDSDHFALVFGELVTLAALQDNPELFEEADKKVEDQRKYLAESKILNEELRDESFSEKHENNHPQNRAYINRKDTLYGRQSNSTLLKGVNKDILRNMLEDRYNAIHQRYSNTDEYDEILFHAFNLRFGVSADGLTLYDYMAHFLDQEDLDKSVEEVSRLLKENQAFREFATTLYKPLKDEDIDRLKDRSAVYKFVLEHNDSFDFARRNPNYPAFTSNEDIEDTGAIYDPSYLDFMDMQIYFASEKGDTKRMAELERLKTITVNIHR